jgi:hypothetical protein
MFLHNQGLSHRLNRARAISLRFLAIAVILGVFAVSPAIGQSIYSDSWTWSPGQTTIEYDEENPTPDPITYVVGCGITEDYYNGYPHEYSVVTTITSPDGHSEVAGGGGQYYARAEVDLILDLNNPGDFFISSDHSYYCSIINNEINSGSTYAGITVGISISCYELRSYDSATRTARLTRKEPCVTHCGGPGDVFTFRYDPALGPPQQLVVAEPYTKVDGNVTCSHVFTWRRYSGVCNCGNVEAPLLGFPF